MNIAVFIHGHSDIYSAAHVNHNVLSIYIEVNPCCFLNDISLSSIWNVSTWNLKETKSSHQMPKNRSMQFLFQISNLIATETSETPSKMLTCTVHSSIFIHYRFMDNRFQCVLNTVFVVCKWHFRLHVISNCTWPFINLWCLRCRRDRSFWNHLNFNRHRIVTFNPWNVGR